MDEEQYSLNPEQNWRDLCGNEKVMLACGITAYEREVYLAVEKLTVYLNKTEDRNPNEEDIGEFIMMLRGND